MNTLVEKYRNMSLKNFVRKLFLYLIRASLFFIKTKFYYLLSTLFLLNNEKYQAWSFLGRYGRTQYPCVNVIKYTSMEIKLFIDSKNKYPYINHNNKRLYFPKKYANQALDMYRTLLIEQDSMSAHQYVKTNDVFFKTTLLDIGAAEGIVSLNNIEKVDFVYIFEYDQDWIDALELTFEPWKNKTKIIKKFVSDIDAENSLKLDTFMKSKSIDNLFIKMDIEGTEMKALNGASYIFENAKNIKFSICTYHKKNDQYDIPRFLKKYGYKHKFSNGYLLIGWWLRKGIVNNC